MSEFDVVIIGGGATGNVIARGLLKHTGFSVALVEANAYTSDGSHPGFDARVIALAKRTVDELAALDIDAGSAGAVPIKHIQVSDKGAAGLCQLNADDFHVSHFGQVISLKHLGEALQIPPETPGFSLFCPLHVSSVSRTQDVTELTLSNGETLRARLVVLADGGRSPLHEELGFERTAEDYRQTAIVVNVITQKPHEHRAYERFTAEGPVAFLPYDPGFATGHRNACGFSVVWTVSPDRAETLMQSGDKAFIQALQKDFGWRQGAILQAGERTAYPLTLQRTVNTTTHRAVVCGNASQTLHPIAGQGFNLGLRDACALVAQLVDADDPGAFHVLRRYALNREQDKKATITLTDGLVRLFSNDNRGLLAARNAGLMAMDNCPSLKSFFVRQTTGFAPGA